MVDFEKLKLYKQYLNTIQDLLDSYFENQKEYLACKKGCSYCCEKGQYPYSELEFEYLLTGFMGLPDNEKQEIIERIKELKETYNGEMYKCPFLGKDNACMVYNYRGLICRTFGLLKPDKNGEIIMPFCQSLGLNYSKVYDRERKMLDENLIKNGEYKNTPKAYQIGLKTLMSEDLFEGEPLKFGEIKSLIDWL